MKTSRDIDWVSEFDPDQRMTVRDRDELRLMFSHALKMREQETQVDARRAALNDAVSIARRYAASLEGHIAQGTAAYVADEISILLDDAAKNHSAEFYAELEGNAGGVLAVPGRKP